MKKLFAFGLEKMVCTNVGKKVTMIFDMQDAGLSNMDLELMRFIITTCFQVRVRPRMLYNKVLFRF